MKEYILNIFTASFICCIADIISPANWQKYIRVLSGFLVLSVIVSPVLKVKNIHIPSLEISDMQSTDEGFLDGISTELEKNIEKDIRERLLSEYGIKADARVYLDTDSEHKIRGVEKIVLYGNISESAANRLKEVYGCDRIEY